MELPVYLERRALVQAALGHENPCYILLSVLRIIEQQELVLRPAARSSLLLVFGRSQLPCRRLDNRGPTRTSRLGHHPNARRAERRLSHPTALHARRRLRGPGKRLDAEQEEHEAPQELLAKHRRF